MDISAILGEVITIFIMAFALGMDAFSVGLGMGLIPLKLRQIVYIGITIGVFHVWMPLAGILIGRFLSDQFGMIATIVGGVLLLLLGIQMIISSFRKEEEPMITPVGFGLVIFSLGVSLDSFSVGLSLGIYKAHIFIVILMFGFVSMILTWIGLILGRRVQKWMGQYSEAFGGCILFAFGIKLLLPF